MNENQFVGICGTTGILRVLSPTVSYRIYFIYFRT